MMLNTVGAAAPANPAPVTSGSGLTPTAPADKNTAIRIKRALAKPGATGKKGFLLWVEAGFPKAMANKILQAASKHVSPQALAAAAHAGGTPPANPGTRVWTAGQAAPAMPAQGSLPAPALQGYAPRVGNASWTLGRYGPARPGYGLPHGVNGLGFLGDDSSSLDYVTLTTDTTPQALPPVSATTAATPSTPADSSWTSDISSAISAIGQLYLTKTQVNASQQIFNTNLQRAQQGLPPIPTNPTAYGLPAPTVNVGISSTTLKPLLWLAGGIAAVILLGMTARGREKPLS
jgi:hypothetical protein